MLSGTLPSCVSWPQDARSVWHSDWLWQHSSPLERARRLLFQESLPGERHWRTVRDIIGLSCFPLHHRPEAPSDHSMVPAECLTLGFSEDSYLIPLPYQIDVRTGGTDWRQKHTCAFEMHLSAVARYSAATAGFDSISYGVGITSRIASLGSPRVFASREGWGAAT
jgi:hypothetical protein